MMDPQELQYLLGRIDERQQITTEGIVRGVKEFSEYQKLCGVILGLDYAREILKDHAKNLEEPEDE